MPGEEKKSETQTLQPLTLITSTADEALVLASRYSEKDNPDFIYFEKIEAYTLCSFNELPLDPKPIQGRIYLDKKADYLDYCVLSPQGEVIRGSFGPQELLVSPDNVDVVQSQDALNLNDLELKKAILQKTLERGHTQRINTLHYFFLKPQNYELVSKPDEELDEYTDTLQKNQFIRSQGGIWYFDFKNQNLIPLKPKAYKTIDVEFSPNPKIATAKDLREILQNTRNPPLLDYELAQDAVNINVGNEPLTEATLRYFELNLFDELAQREQVTKPDSYERFVFSFNADISRINMLIQAYNLSSPDNRDEKIARLQLIFQEIKHINAKYSDFERGHYVSDYSQISSTLYKAIINQTKILGLNSVAQLERQNASQESSVKNALSSIIRNMSEERARALIKILSHGKKYDVNALKKLYREDDPQYADYQEFLNHYKIKYLGGGNSQNFKIKSKRDGSVCVLKVANRMHNPGSAEEKLRSRSLANTLIPVHTERLVMIKSGDAVVERSLQVMDFMPVGDVLAFSQEQHRLIKPNKGHKIPESFYDQALDIYRQMGTILLGVQGDECAFPDLKNTNWLLDKQGKLWLSDAKSFVFTHKGNLDPEYNKRVWANVISTPAYASLKNEVIYSADAEHTFILGKNLYEYLAQPHYVAFDKMRHYNQFDFSAPVFKTPRGFQLQMLIQKMTHADPTKRIPLQQAVAELNELQIQPQRDKCKALMREISDRIHAQHRGLLFLDLIQHWSEAISKRDPLQKFDALKQEVHSIELSLTQLSLGLENCINLLNELQELALFDTKLQAILGEREEEIKKATSPEDLQQINVKITNTLDSALSPRARKCMKLLKGIQQDGFKNDACMNEFFLRKGQEILRATPDQLKNIERELIAIYNDPTPRYIKGILQSLVTTNVTKAVTLSTAITCVPVEQRRGIMKAQTPEGVKLQSLIKDSKSRRTVFDFFQSEPQQQGTRTQSSNLKFGF